MNAHFDGFYVAYLTGKAGRGLAMLAFKDGCIFGADAAGVLFDGIFIESCNAMLSIMMTVETPSGVNLIQGGLSGPEGIKTKLEFEMTTDFSIRPFVRIYSSREVVNVKIVKLEG